MIVVLINSYIKGNSNKGWNIIFIKRVFLLSCGSCILLDGEIKQDKTLILFFIWKKKDI
jgi:hypothetical protein